VIIKKLRITKKKYQLSVREKLTPKNLTALVGMPRALAGKAHL
jgi:hypothetical protein